MTPRHFLLRAVRRGPLVPARLWWCDHDPADPDNKLDRGRLSTYPRADIAGVEVDPERLFDRLGVWRRTGDLPLSPAESLAALADPAQQTPRPAAHWAYAQPISKAEYDYQIARLRWAETARPDDPTLKPRRAVTEVVVPSFDRERLL